MLPINIIYYIRLFAMKIYGLIASIGTVIVLFFIYVFGAASEYKQAQASFLTQKGEVKFSVEIADTLAKRTKGLMGRESLPEKSGMLFIFPSEGKYSFWMKNTLIPLDIIFVSENLEIVRIQKEAQPCKVLDCEFYGPETPAKYVIEINGGLSDKLGIKEGQKVNLSLG